MAKPVGQSGSGTNNFGGITAFNRTWSVRGEESGPDLDKNILSSRQLAERLPFEGYGRTGLIMTRGQLPEYFNGDTSGLPDMTALYMATYTLSDPRNILTVTRGSNGPYFWHLFIGSDINSIGAECFKDYKAAGPVTRFDGGLKDIGEKAFYSYGNNSGNVFENLRNLIIHKEAFSKSPIGGMQLWDCDISDADSAFKDSLDVDPIRIVRGVGNLIPNSFAENCSSAGEIYLKMDGGTIGDKAFYDCRGMTLEIVYDCTEVGVSAFEKNEFISTQLPSTITLFKEKSFKDAGVGLLKIAGGGDALVADFKDECFMNNSIKIVSDNSDVLIVDGNFEYRSFYKSSGNSKFLIKGSILGKEAFALNPFYKLELQANISNDYTFYRSNSTEPIVLSGNIVGRHTFTTPAMVSANTYHLLDPTKISNSFRTFQMSPRIPGRPPAPSLGWIPTTAPAEWSDVHDRTCWYREDAVENYGSTDWINDAPAQIEVSFGSTRTTILKQVTQLDEGGSIQEFYYSEDFPGTEEGGYDPDSGSVGFDYYTVTVYHLPWGQYWEDLLETGYPVEYGKGGWVATASSNNYAQVSPVYLQTDNPETFVGDFYDENGGGGAAFNFKGLSSSVPSTTGVSYTKALRPSDELLAIEREESGAVLRVPTSYVDTADGDDFRRKHMFYGVVNSL